MKTTNIAQLRNIVSQHQCARIGGVEVDAQTASAVLQVHDALNEANRQKFAGLIESRLAHACQLAWSLAA